MKKPSPRAVDLTIVIPAYREEKRIGKTLDELASFLRKDDLLKAKNVEVIVVSADSPDSTHEIVNGKSKRFRRLTLLKPGPKVGKGRDVRIGMLAANGEAVMFMDADMATPLKYIRLFYETYLTGADIVIAVRQLRRYRRDPVRIFVSAVGNILFRIAGGVWIEDSQCGFKLFSKRANATCFSQLQITGWGFDMEVIAAASANKLTIQTVLVPDWTAVPNGTFEDDIVMNTLHSFSDLAHIFARRVMKRYKIT